MKDFPLEDSVDQLEWAIDIMLNMQVQADARKEEGALFLFIVSWCMNKLLKCTSHLNSNNDDKKY